VDACEAFKREVEIQQGMKDNRLFDGAGERNFVERA
jgi:hypothetical protein